MTIVDIIDPKEVEAGWDLSGASRYSPARSLNLFDRLDDCTPGRAVRRCERSRSGPGGAISRSSTVHNIFPRLTVPRWAFLEQVVKHSVESATLSNFWHCGTPPGERKMSKMSHDPPRPGCRRAGEEPGVPDRQVRMARVLLDPLINFADVLSFRTIRRPPRPTLAASGFHDLIRIAALERPIPVLSARNMSAVRGRSALSATQDSRIDYNLALAIDGSFDHRRISAVPPSAKRNAGTRSRQASPSGS